MDGQSTSSNPTDEAIEAIIQQATSAAPYARSGPLRDTRTQLYVGNLPYRVRWQDLKDLFRKAGTVLRADVSLGPDNRSRGFGTVLLATAEDAGRAVDTFNGYSWQSRILEVRLDRQLQEFDSPLPSIASSSSTYPQLLSSASKAPAVPDNPDNYLPPASDPNSSRSLFVGNLPFHCQWQDLKDLFRQAGTIIRADVVLGPDGRSRGFGTVIFATDLDAERALKMFNGFEYNGRVLYVHHDKYSYSTQPETTSTSPIPGSSSGVSSHSRPTHITLPPGYMLDFVPPSGPTSPYDMSRYQHQHLHDQQQQQRQTQIQQLPLQLQQQYQHRQQQGQHPRHQHQQQRNRLYTPSQHDIDNLSETLASASTLKPTASASTHVPDYSGFHPPSSSSSSRPSSTSTPAITLTTKHPITIPIFKPPPSSHTNTTTSSGSDKSGSEMFSRMSSASVTSAASSKHSLILSRPPSQSQGFSFGQIRTRGQPFQTSPRPDSSPELSHPVSGSASTSTSPHPYQHPHSRSSSHHRSSHSHSSSHTSQSSVQSSSHSTPDSACCPSSRPSSSNPNHHPQRPGPISLPPPLLPSQIAFNIPLHQLSPHGYTPLGMSVSVSVSPMVEYPGGFGFSSGMYGQYPQYEQRQQFVQPTAPQGLVMTPSMPSFTLLPSVLPPGLHATPSGSTRVSAGGGHSGGHRRSRSKSLARKLERENELGNVGGNQNENNSNASISSRRSSSPSGSPSSSTRRRRFHHQQHQNQHQYNIPIQGQQSYHQNQSPRRSAAAAGGGGSNVQPNASIHSQPQPVSMHINLASIPGAFSPGVVMSPGTFYGRPGEAPTFINAAVGAPLTARVDGNGVASDVGGRELPSGDAAQIPDNAQGQWYHQNQTHGSYFYAMSSPRRRTPTGMEPKDYFDSLYFPAGVNFGSGYTSSMGGSALVNEIMKDGHLKTLGVDVDIRQDEGTGKGEEEEKRISDGDGDDEGDDDADGDADVGEEDDTRPPPSEDKDGDRRSSKMALSSSRTASIISRTQSLPSSNVPHHHQQHTWRSMERRATEVDSDLEEAMIESAQMNGSIPIRGDEQEKCSPKQDEEPILKSPSHAPRKTTSTSVSTSLKRSLPV